MEHRNIFIFLEDSKGRDRLFVEAFLKRELNTYLPADAYIKTNGWAGIKNEAIVRQLQINDANGGINLILFDADDNQPNQLNLIKEHLSSINVNASVFLFPDNQQTGELETLLMRLANWDDKAFFLACYENYLTCVYNHGLTLSKESYRIPDYKDMFQAYSSFFRMGEVDFYDEAFWDFSRPEA